MLHCSAEATAAVNDSSKVMPAVQVIRRRIESSRAVMHEFLPVRSNGDSSTHSMGEIMRA